MVVEIFKINLGTVFQRSITFVGLVDLEMLFCVNLPFPWLNLGHRTGLYSICYRITIRG